MANHVIEKWVRRTLITIFREPAETEPTCRHAQKPRQPRGEQTTFNLILNMWRIRDESEILNCPSFVSVAIAIHVDQKRKTITSSNN